MTRLRFERIQLWAVLLLGLMIAAFAEWMRHRNAPIPNRAQVPFVSVVLAETTMRDGTILAIHGFDGGTNGSTLNVNVSALNPAIRVKDGVRTLQASNIQSQVRLWLTRRDPITGKSLDFEWWKHTVITDQFGIEITDNDPAVHTVYVTDSNRISGQRPLKCSPVSNRGPHCWVANSGFPNFRAKSPIELKFYDMSDILVAEVLLPNPCVNIPSTPASDSIPSTKQLPEVDVTLKAVEVDFSQEQPVERPKSHRRINPVFEFQSKVDPASEWRVSWIALQDALGNPIPLDRVSESSFHESHWKVSCQITRDIWSPCSSSEFVETDWLDLPQRDHSNDVHLVAKNDLIDSCVKRINGHGAIRYRVALQPNSGPISQGMSKSSGRLTDNRHFEIQVDGHATENAVTLNSDVPSVVLTKRSSDLSRTLVVGAIDDQQRRLEVREGTIGGENFAFLGTYPESKRVRLRIAVQRDYRVEFSIIPPERASATSK